MMAICALILIASILAPPLCLTHPRLRKVSRLGRPVLLDSQRDRICENMINALVRLRNKRAQPRSFGSEVRVTVR